MAVWLVLVLATLGTVIARQTRAVVLATELAERREERAVLEAQRAELLREIRTAESRAVLVERAARLGLRLPVDSEIVLLPTISAQER